MNYARFPSLGIKAILLLPKPIPKHLKWIFIFIYKNKTNNAIVEYTTDELMAISEDEATYEDFENNYVYVDRKDKIIKKRTEAKLADFELQDKEQKTDMKESIIEQKRLSFYPIYKKYKTASF